MYRSLLGRDCQLGMPKLLALLIVILLLPVSGWTEKSETSFTCCQRYEKKNFDPKYFNYFKKSYQWAKICVNQNEAVVFKLKDGRRMCADPQKPWAQELMRRIDQVPNKANTKLGKKDRNPIFKVQVGTRPSQGGTNTWRSTGAPGTQRGTTPLASARRPGASTGYQESSKTPANTVQAEGTDSPTSERQTTGSPMIAHGEANKVNSTWAPGTGVPTSMAVVLREVTHPLTTFPGQEESSKTPANTVQAEGTGSPTSEGQTTGRPIITHRDANNVNPTWAPGTEVPTSIAVVLREMTHPLTTFPGEQESSKTPANTVQAEATGSPTSEGQTTGSPTIANKVNPTRAPGTEVPTSIAVVLREVTHPLTTFPGEQEGGGSDQKAPEITGSSSALEGATTVAPVLKPKKETDRASQVGEGEGTKKGLGNSKVAVLILAPTVLILISIIVYLRCKRRGWQAPKYQTAPLENPEGIYDAL